MTMNISSGRSCVSTCCQQDTEHPSGTRCYWNVSLTTVEKILPHTLPLKTTVKELHDMIPGNMIPCPNNTVCYSDCNSGNNISSNLFGTDTIFMNHSIDSGLACRFDAREYCFQSDSTDRTENVTSVCNTFFDMETTMQYTFAQYNMEVGTATYPMAISCLFLAATFFIYTIIPEFKNLHGLIIRTYISCCFVNFLTFILKATFLTISCGAFLNISTHFTLVASCSWLNVMSFDIWWTFRHLRDSSKQAPRKKYIIYSIYAWTIPMLAIGVALIIEFLPNAPERIIKPGLHNGCWLAEFTQLMVYIGIPVALTIPFNICFFVLAAISITRHKKATSQSLEGSDSRRFNDEKNRLYLYLKLFFITGMTWVGEIILYLLFTGDSVPRYVTVILHFPTRIQGLIFFILLVCNGRTKRLLSKRLGLKDRTIIQWIELAAVRIRTRIRQPQVA